MYRKLLKEKTHRALATGTEPDFEGNITVDRDLLDRAGILEHRFVLVANLSNGARFETYALAADPASGIIELNGPGGEVCSLSQPRLMSRILFRIHGARRSSC